MRKRWRLDAPVDAFVHHVDVVGSLVSCIVVIGFLAFRDTDADALSGPAACVGSTVTDGGPCALHGRVVLPAHQQREVLRTR